MNGSYDKEERKYQEVVRKMREKAMEEHELCNIENVSRGRPKVPFVFKPPPPPVYHLFIRISTSDLVNRKASYGGTNK